MAIRQSPDLSEFADFAEILRGHRNRSGESVRRALSSVRDRFPDAKGDALADVSQAVEGTLRTLDIAAEELRVQNEALFAARVELEASSAHFRELFDLAPAAYFVTTAEMRITYVNQAACTLLSRPANALVGHPLVCFVPVAARTDFRSAVIRSCDGPSVTTWTAKLVPSGTSNGVECRFHVRPTFAAGNSVPCALYWNVTEEPDEDLF